MDNFNFFEQYSYAGILEDALSRVPDSVDKRQGSIIYDALAPACYELAFLYMELAKVVSKLDINNLEGDDLDRFIFPRTGQQRYSSRKSTGQVTVTGQEGTVIPLGTIIKSTSVDFKTTKSATIGSSGTVVIDIECLETGTVGNVPEGSINTFADTILGIADVHNFTSITNGRNAESDDSFRLRYFERLQNPGKSGNSMHYQEWARQVDEVGYAFARSGSAVGSVEIFLATKDWKDVSLEGRAAVKKVIDENIPLGVTAIVQNGASMPITITGTITYKKDHNVDKVKQDIENRIVEYMNKDIFTLRRINVNHVGAIIVSTEGVDNYTALEISSAGITSNITVYNYNLIIPNFVLTMQEETI